ncbi:MAG: peptidoglycan-binding protein [Clostridia bacterium]|nr:peptidoglycan-binding protein [Clostridia bacterium]
MPPLTPIIPEAITVHLGPPDTAAQNVTVPFADYIKNVASSEIYPTWPESALRANIYAQVSYALNRVYTEFYRSRGYNFDITNSTATDQSFVYGRDIFENISQIVDEIFDNYLTQGNAVEPYFAQYCDGVRTTCGGLSQWGSVSLARQGYTPYEILRYYYGDNIRIVRNAPVGEPGESYPGRLLDLGVVGDDVRQVQIRLNRISKNYPSIPKIRNADGIFGPETEEAVREFQRIFSLDPDGIVGKATWYSIQRIYFAVKKISDLSSEGISVTDVTPIFDTELSEGSTSDGVRELQFFLSFLSLYNSAIPALIIDGIFGPATERAVRVFQNIYALPETGVVDTRTWDTLYRAYRGIVDSLPPGYLDGVTEVYPGYPLRNGSRGEPVRTLQTYLNFISNTYTQIPKVEVDGVFGPATERAVSAYESVFGLTPTGFVGSTLWNSIAATYRDLYGGAQTSTGQYPGYDIR